MNSLLRRLTFHEMWAIGIALLLLPVYFASQLGGRLFGFAWLADPLIFRLIWALIWGFAFCAAFGFIFLKPEVSPARTCRVCGRFLPIIALLGTSAVTFKIDDLVEHDRRLRFAEVHRAELSTGIPAIYRKGFPDTGSAIVRSPGQDPTYSSQTAIFGLAGERTKSCTRLDERDWICFF